MINRLKRVLIGGIALAAYSLLSGCDSLPSIPSVGSNDTIQITTNPPGASVYANDKLLGTTPLTVKPSLAWDSGFVPGKDVGMVYQYKGTITIEKPGCETYKAEVNDPMLYNDIAIDLNCGPQYRNQTTTGPASSAPVVAPSGRFTAPATGTVDYETPEEIMARRLRRLEGLRDRGLITDDEYQRVRTRILNEL